MAKCAECGKGVHFGNAVSHSHRRSNKIWKSNLKSVRVKVNGGTKKMYVCTSCLRSGKVETAEFYYIECKELSQRVALFCLKEYDLYLQLKRL